MTGSELEQQQPGELEPLDPEQQELVDSIKGEVDPDSLILPTIKLTHPLTREVEDGEVESGVYINALTKQVYGDDVPFIVCGIYKGRFFSDNDGDGPNYSAQGSVAPDSWPEQYRGKAFADLADAEERWKADSNEGVHPFGHGPPIATTHNFVGFVVDDDSDLPLRLSLMRSSTPAALKLKTMIVSQRAPWDRVFQLRVRKDVKGDRKFLVTEIAAGDKTDAETRQKAVKIATQYRRAAQSNQVQEAGETEDEGRGKKAKPRDKGGLGVS